MRKVHIVTLGVLSLGALAASQPAYAGWVKKRVCNTAYLNPEPSRQFANKCRGGWNENNCSSQLVGGGYGVKRCYDIDVLVPSDLKGGGSGLNKTLNRSTNSKNR